MGASFLALVAALAAVPVHPQRPGDQRAPSAALSDAGLVVVWVDARPGRSDVLTAFSADLSSFTPPLTVSGATGKSEVIRPHAAARGARVVLTWADASRGDHDVYLVLSSDGGRSFSAPVLAAGGPGGQVDPRAAILADGSIALCYHDSFGSTSEDLGVVWRARVTVSRDGASFTPPSAPAPPEAASFQLFAAVSGGGTPQAPLGVVWLDEAIDGGPTQVRFATSIDGGASFLAPLRLDRPGLRHLRPRLAATRLGFVALFDALVPAEEQAPPAPLVIGEALYLDVETVSSTSAGATFGPPGFANQTRALHQLRGDLAADGDRVALAWVDHSLPDQRRLVVRTSSDAGRSYGAERLIDGPVEGGELDHPAVAVRGDRVVVVYEAAERGPWMVRAAVVSP